MSAAGARPVLLVLRALGLGDLLTAVPALRALADAFPGHHRILATTSNVAPLALHAALADEVLPAAPLEPLAGGPALPEVAVNLHGCGPQSHTVLWALRPRRLICYGTDGWPGPPWDPNEHEVERWCRLLRASGIPVDAGRLDVEPPRRPVPPVAVGATLVHPGAARPARRWPAERWAAVARSEAARGRKVVVTGGPGEERLAERVAAMAGLPPDVVLAGRMDVLDLAATVDSAARVVCGDTGVAHLATALRRPSVVLFGPVPPSSWGPPPDRPWHVALWAGRLGDPWADEPDPGLLAIAVPDVLGALARLPDQESESRDTSKRSA